ncbi:MAG: hypothetical protein AAGB13_18030, partial [Cyanobacteria bacterium P01_F01_bin.33]
MMIDTTAWKRLAVAVGLSLGAAIASSGLMGERSQAQLLSVPSVQDRLGPFCQQSSAEVAQKNQLRLASASSDEAWSSYTRIVADHRLALERCRQQTFPRTQAIWLRLHPCDIDPLVLADVMDRIVNLGYNRVYIEVFYDGQVLLPRAEAGPWKPVAPDTDLFATALKAARTRGLSAYAWVFSLNFGYSYAQRGDVQNSLARNGVGETSLVSPEQVEGTTGAAAGPDQVFVDPHSPQIRQEYMRMMQSILQRRPDGVLFDYIRYPHGTGDRMIAYRPNDLWIFGPSSRQAFLDLATNEAGRDLLGRFLDRGYVTAGDIAAVRSAHPKSLPAWRSPTPGKVGVQPPQFTRWPSAAVGQREYQRKLWPLAITFARQTILDYLDFVSAPVRQQRIPSGAVFFPEGNRQIRGGYDSRLQPWQSFSESVEWHPMSYAVCGGTSCIGDQVQQVLEASPVGTEVCPVLAGSWKEALGRPALSFQFGELQRRFPQLQCVSTFAYSWTEIEHDRQRASCSAGPLSSFPAPERVV